MKHLNLIIYTLIFTVICLNSEAQIIYPETKMVNQTDTYFGVQVKDPYRWLEDDNSSETKDWVKTQNSVTQHYFNDITYKEKIKNRLTELWNFDKKSVPIKKGNYYFSFINNGLQNQSVFCYQKSLLDDPIVLLDPNLFSVDGTTSLSGITISKDAKYLAYGISSSGSDWVEIHIMEIESKIELKEVIKWVKFSDISWKGSGFYYSRYNEPSKDKTFTQKNQFHKVYYHQLNTPQHEDELVFDDKENPNRNFSAHVTHDEKFLCIYGSESTSGNSLLVKDLSNKENPFVNIVSNFENDFSVVENIGNQFYVYTNYKASNYKLIKIDLTSPHASHWFDILPENDHLLEQVVFCGNKLVSNYLENVSSKLYVHSLSGKIENNISLTNICKVNGMNSTIDGNELLYSTVSYTHPEEIHFYDSQVKTSKRIFKPNCNFKSNDYVTKQVFFTSKDGTKISMFMTHRNDLILDGNNPCFVFGYGGFNISYTPEFRIDRALFLEAGGIYCVPNLRGGGEYGENWHASGIKCKKQNVFDDFIGACEYLINNKYTTNSKLAIHGRSNGGLLIGAVMTQRPDIAKVAIPTVGVLDMLRFHLFTIGRAWTVDYGCSENENEFKCLYNYSPLHSIKKHEYPATLVLTGDHDDRVVPAHSFKFISTLQKNNTSSNPTLIRIDSNAGHGSGKPTDKQILEFTDMWSFVFYNLGMKYN